MEFHLESGLPQARIMRLLLWIIPSILLVDAGKKIDCDFEQDTCGWVDPNGATWIRVNSSSKYDPGHDHTLYNGNWLSTTKKFDETQEFTLISPQIPATVKESCFTFWYHFFGFDEASFEVLLNQAETVLTADSLWKKYKPQSNNWLIAHIYIEPQPKPFYLFFKALLSARFHDSVGLDDIRYLSTPCPKSVDTDFESKHTSWKLSGNLVVNGTGASPFLDHTTNTKYGHFVLSNGTNHTATLTVPLSQIDPPAHEYLYCLKFWYQFSTGARNDTTSYIKFAISNNRYFSEIIDIKSVYEDRLEYSWNPATVEFPKTINSSAGPPMLVLTTYTQEAHTAIGIDDIVVMNRVCENPGFCDFESDFCGWKVDIGRISWYRTTGGAAGFKKTPKVDANTGTANGFFLLAAEEFFAYSETAVMRSPPLKGLSGTKCFRFAYYAVANSTDIIALRIQVKDLTRPRVHSNGFFNTTLEDQWKYTYFPIENVPSRFVIEIWTGYREKPFHSDIAVDDFKLDNSCQPRPQTTTIEPAYERRWDCNFEYLCNYWSHDHSWIVTNYRQAPDIVDCPKGDHTYHTSFGHYLLWNPLQVEPNTTVSSKITSTPLTAREHCLSFWYYDSSDMLYTIDVKSLIHGFTYRTIRPTVATSSWKLARIEIGTYGTKNDSIVIELKTQDAVKDSLAIDDIHLKPGFCDRLDDYVYTLDEYEDLELNRITPYNTFMGIIYRHSSNYHQDYPLAPRNDHTTGDGGYFLFMNQKNNLNTTYTDWLVVDYLPSMKSRDPARCVKFAFMVYKNASVKVSVTPVQSNTNGAVYFQSTANHADNWAVAQFTYSAYYTHKIVFSLSKPFDDVSYAALDDISVSQRNCKPPIECDFDDDFCSYDIDMNDKKKEYGSFGRFVGPPSDRRWPGPPFDHTKKSYGGGYIYLTAYPDKDNEKRYATLETPIVKFSPYLRSNFCLSFWSQINQPDGILQIDLGMYGDQAITTMTLYALINVTETKWTPHYLAIDMKDLHGYSELKLYISAITQKVNTVVALDDIRFTLYDCTFNSHFKCANNVVVNTAQVCDFHKDCPEGRDEQNCGNCDFETAMCGWIPEYETVNDPRWTRLSAQNSNDGPKVDGSNNSAGHYLLLFHENKSRMPAKLARDDSQYYRQLKHAYYTCVITFDYYMHSKAKNSFNQIDVYAGNSYETDVIVGTFKTNSTQWQKAIVYVGSFVSEFTVEFSGSSHTDNEVLAIDNIKFQNCSLPDPLPPSQSCPDELTLCDQTRICIHPEELCDFEDNCGDNSDEQFRLCAPFNDPIVVAHCDFEKTFDYHNFTPEFVVETNNNRQELFFWEITIGSTFNILYKFGPGSDHTTKDREGQYAVLRTSFEEFIGKTAELYTPMMTSTSNACTMRFFYYNNGNGEWQNKLKVYVRYADSSIDDTGTLFESKVSLPKWVKARVSHKSASPFQFVFSGELPDIRSSLSLDDVSFSFNCLRSDAQRTIVERHSKSGVTVVIILLVVTIAAIGAFFVVRKYRQGQLSLNTLSTVIFRKNEDQNSIINENYKQ